MTEATCNKFDLLKQQYTQTLQTWHTRHQTQLKSSQGSMSGVVQQQQPPPAPVMLTVMLTGQVLSKAHVRAGSYIPAAERGEVLKLLAGMWQGYLHCTPPATWFSVSWNRDSKFTCYV